MALTKCYAGYASENGWVEQREVEMHPLEEAAILKHWAVHDVKIKIPPKPTKDEEHEWLIAHGADFVKQKREEWQKIHDTIKPEIEAAEAAHQAAHQAWCDHADLCVRYGYDKDIYPGDARLMLKKPK